MARVKGIGELDFPPIVPLHEHAGLGDRSYYPLKTVTERQEGKTRYLTVVELRLHFDDPIPTRGRYTETLLLENGSCTGCWIDKMRECERPNARVAEAYLNSALIAGLMLWSQREEVESLEATVYGSPWPKKPTRWNHLRIKMVLSKGVDIERPARWLGSRARQFNGAIRRATAATY
ncbi:hypothetical protein HY375_01050 [Candidatus Berkelbacteria bacterium]|nr:hypothetical protein [Candidatus Berkelbacteria bacterium]